jgi:hypothetical protein
MLELLELTLLDVVIAIVWFAATLLIAAWASAATGVWVARHCLRWRRSAVRPAARERIPPDSWR